MGARGNSGVIISQMLRGFAHHVRHRSEDRHLRAGDGNARSGCGCATGAPCARSRGRFSRLPRQRLKRPTSWRCTNATFIASASASFARQTRRSTAPRINCRFSKKRKVVDSGGAGFVYFVEGILRFLPEFGDHPTGIPATSGAPKRFYPGADPSGRRIFVRSFCFKTPPLPPHDLRHLLEPRGESLLVIGAPPTIKVHIHTDNPDRVQDIAGRHGRLTRVKVDNMERQHQVAGCLEPPSVSRSIVAIVPGPGFERIARELGAEVT